MEQLNIKRVKRITKKISQEVNRFIAQSDDMLSMEDFLQSIVKYTIMYFKNEIIESEENDGNDILFKSMLDQLFADWYQIECNEKISIRQLSKLCIQRTMKELTETQLAKLKSASPYDDHLSEKNVRNRLKHIWYHHFRIAKRLDTIEVQNKCASIPIYLKNYIYTFYLFREVYPLIDEVDTELNRLAMTSFVRLDLSTNTAPKYLNKNNLDHFIELNLKIEEFCSRYKEYPDDTYYRQFKFEQCNRDQRFWKYMIDSIYLPCSDIRFYKEIYSMLDRPSDKVEEVYYKFLYEQLESLIKSNLNKNNHRLSQKKRLKLKESTKETSNLFPYLIDLEFVCRSCAFHVTGLSDYMWQRYQLIRKHFSNGMYSADVIVSQLQNMILEVKQLEEVFDEAHIALLILLNFPNIRSILEDQAFSLYKQHLSIPADLSIWTDSSLECYKTIVSVLDQLGELEQYNEDGQD